MKGGKWKAVDWVNEVVNQRKSINWKLIEEKPQSGIKIVTW